MEKMTHENVHFTEVPTYPGSLRKADYIADALGLTESRLLELADGYFIPHWRIDNGEPLFQLAEVKKWVAKNLINRIDGQDLPFELRIMIDPPKAMDAPADIYEIEGLRQIPIHEYPPGVYFLVKDDRVVYVGQSLDPLRRIGAHRKDKEFDRAYMVPVPSSMLDNVEGALIRAMNPVLNSGKLKIAVGPGDKSADVFMLEKYAKGLKKKIHSIT